MSTTRRRFLKVGVLAAVFAGFPLRNTLGQGWKDRDANPDDPGIAQTDNLANYSKAAFTSYLNSIFELQTAFGNVPLTLTEITDLPSARGGECFSLTFRGGSRRLRQDTYRLVHPALGAFALLLVPAGADRNGAQGYTATINRLSQADVMNNPAPSRIRSAAPSKPAADASPSPGPGSAVSPAVVSPETPATAPTTVPEAPAVVAPKSRKPARKKKASWKFVD